MYATAAVNRGLEIEMVSKSSRLPRLILTSHGSFDEGSRMRGKSKYRRTFTGFEPATACTKYWRVKARPKVMRMPYSTGRSILPSYIGVRNIRSKMAPSTKTTPQAIQDTDEGLTPGSQTTVT